MGETIKIPDYHYDDKLGKYILDENIRYHSKRYNKWVFINKGYISDGATGAMDIRSLSWWVHDKLCETYTWRDGTHCSRKQGSQVLSDILKAEGRWARAWYWKHVTYYPHKWGLI